MIEDGEEDLEYDPVKGFIPDSEAPLEDLQQHAADHPFIDQLDISVEAFDDRELTVTVPHREKFANPGMEGVLHGGVVVAILDTIMGFTLKSMVAADSTVNIGPTINLNTNFLAGAKSDMKGIGTVVRIGSSTAIVDGKLQNSATDEIFAIAEGVWRVYEDPE